MLKAYKAIVKQNQEVSVKNPIGHFKRSYRTLLYVTLQSTTFRPTKYCEDNKRIPIGHSYRSCLKCPYRAFLEDVWENPTEHSYRI
jgi:hypothetical protein